MCRGRTASAAFINRLDVEKRAAPRALVTAVDREMDRNNGEKALEAIVATDNNDPLMRRSIDSRSSRWQRKCLAVCFVSAGLLGDRGIEFQENKQLRVIATEKILFFLDVW